MREKVYEESRRCESEMILVERGGNAAIEHERNRRLARSQDYLEQKFGAKNKRDCKCRRGDRKVLVCEMRKWGISGGLQKEACYCFDFRGTQPDASWEILKSGDL